MNEFLLLYFLYDLLLISYWLNLTQLICYYFLYLKSIIFVWIIPLFYQIGCINNWYWSFEFERYTHSNLLIFYFWISSKNNLKLFLLKSFLSNHLFRIIFMIKFESNLLIRRISTSNIINKYSCLFKILYLSYSTE